MEWVFFVTKPSFMDPMTMLQKGSVLVTTVTLFCGAALCILAILYLLYSFCRRWWQIDCIPFLVLILPTLFFSSTSLLLIDNFTYTIFKWGVVSTNGIVRALYGIFFLVLTLVLYYRLAIIYKTNNSENTVRRRFWIVVGVLVICLSITLPQLDLSHSVNTSIAESSDVNRPNILLISSDGLSADHMSVYGYERQTTPFLDEFVKSSLKSENGFVNSAKTSGSLVSTYTGKLPITTRMLFPPDTLKGVDSYQHLPGILKTLGYFNVQISTPFYADANSQGLINGFDIANGQLPLTNAIYSYAQDIPFENAKYFIPTIMVRITERLAHIFFIQNMVNPFTEVTSQKMDHSDVNRTKQVLELISSIDKPFLIHVHMLVTHGDYFTLQNQKFSSGIEQTSPWMNDFYDDSILEFDTTVSEIIQQLQVSGKYDNTIIVIFSDHYERWVSDMRVSILIHFPGNAYSGVIYQNTQNLDIAPTILDYLSEDIPDWMEGESMLQMFNNPNPDRVIYSFGPAYTTTNSENLAISDPEKTVAPFYQFGFIQAVVCDRYYKLDLRQRRWILGPVYNYSEKGLCTDSQNSEEIKNLLIQKMKDEHFDINRLTKRPIEEVAPTPYPH